MNLCEGGMKHGEGRRPLLQRSSAPQEAGAELSTGQVGGLHGALVAARRGDGQE